MTATDGVSAPDRSVDRLRDRLLLGLRQRARRVTWLPVGTFVLATFLFMPKAILGLGVFGPFDILQLASPLRDALATTPHVATIIQNDGVQGPPPLEAVVDALRHGHWLVWTPYIAGGEPIGALPLSGVQSVFNLPLVVLPAGYGLGFVAAVRLLFCQAFFYLFLRRFKISVPIATFGAVAYTFCGTNIALFGRINAYLILPALLWAVARILERRRPVDVAWLAVFGSMTWLEGFPAGYANAAVIAGLLALAVAVPLAGARRGGRTIGRRAAVGLALMACGFVLSIGLTAFSLLPFDQLAIQSGLVQRNYTPATRLSDVLVPSYLSVGALGNPQQASVMLTRLPNGSYSGAGNAVELESGAGIVVVLTALAGMFMALFGRLRLSRRQSALYVFALVTVIGGILLIYFDSPLLALFYDLPLLGSSPVSRFRIIVNLGIVLLACLGLEGFLSHRRNAAGDGGTAEDEGGHGDLIVRVSVGVALVALVLILRDAWPGYTGWFGAPLESKLRKELAAEALGSLVATGFAYAMLARAAKKAAKAGAGLVALAGCVLTAATFISVAYPMRNFTPTVSSTLFYPQTSGQTELSDLTKGRYRILGSGLGTFYSNTSALYHFLDLRGLSLSTPPFRKLVQSAIPNAYILDHFKVIYNPGDPINFKSPALDDLGVRYYVGGTNEIPLARNVGVEPPVGTKLLTEVAPLARVIRSRGALTGVAIPVERASSCNGAKLVITAATARGKLIGISKRPALDASEYGAGPLAFPFPVGDAPRGTLVRIALRLAGPACRVAAGVNKSGQLTLSQLINLPDGLRIVADDDAVFYERPRAHPVAWLTGNWLSTRSNAAALALATAPGRRPGDPVPVAGAGAPPARSAPGTVQGLHYVSNGIDVRVSTRGRSLLATGFAEQSGDWSVDVDGHPAHLATVDGALLGTVVGPGQHVVSFRFHIPRLLLGIGISVLSLLVLAALVVVDRRRWPV